MNCTSHAATADADCEPASTEPTLSAAPPPNEAGDAADFDGPDDQGNPVLLPVDSIVVAPGRNPRTYFGTADFDSLVASIRETGLAQPVLVRPNPYGEGYQLIAGERRLRAMRQLGKATIPALVRNLDDEMARKAALVENTQRRDLGPGEEAMCAQQHLDAYEGDYEAAARSLGWGVQKLRHRLKLLQCVPEVMRSLIEEQITLGHAELLATMPAERQLKALPKILANNIGVSELRQQINSFTTALSEAIFDREKAGCATCPYNTTTKRGLFDAVGDADRCTNHECFGARTQEALVAKKEALKDEFGTVALVSEKVPGSTIPLVMLGETGVGPTQFDACRACVHRGALVQDAPGPHLGRVDQPLCFNRPCHQSMVDAYAESLAAEKPGDDASDQGSSNAGPTPAGAAKPTPAIKPAAKGKAKSVAKATPGAVTDQYAAVLRRAVVSHVQNDPVSVLSIALYALLRVTGDEVSRKGLEGVVKALNLPIKKPQSSAGKHNAVPLALLALDKATLQQTIVATVLHLFNENANEAESVFHRKLDRRTVIANLAAHHQLDLQAHLRVDDEFLSAHTKAGIEHLLDESKFSAWMKEQPDGEKRLRTLLASGKADLVKGVLAAGYPGFATYMPAALGAQAATWRKQG